MSYSSEHKLISHPHQSLATHLEHVAEVVFRALERKAIPEALFGEDELKRLAGLLVYYHDFGKAMALFQYRIIQVTRAQGPAAPLTDSHREYIESFLDRPDLIKIKELIEDPTYKSHAVTGAVVAESVLGNGVPALLRLIVMEVILRHHGNLKSFTKNLGDEVQRRRHANDYRELLEVQWPLVDFGGLRAFMEPLGYPVLTNADQLHRRTHRRIFKPIYKALADNSDDYRPYFRTLFLFSLLLAGDKGDLMLNERRKDVGKVYLFPADLIQCYKEVRFGTSSPTGINAIREAAYRKVMRTVNAHPDRPFYSITLPTGLGKTLTAYNAAVQLQRRLAEDYRKEGHDVTPRIIYCLPFTSVIDQNAAVLTEIIEANGISDTVVAKHHYLADWPTQKAGAGDLEYSQREYLVEGWEYSLTVTTFVQFIETLFSNRNRKLRKFHNLANAIVILDEVQSIPAEYFRAVATALTELNRLLGTRFIFVTATQPVLLPPNQPVLELTDPEPGQAYTRQLFAEMNRIDLDLSLWLEGKDNLDDTLPRFRRDLDERPDDSFLFIFNLIADSQQAFDYLREAGAEARDGRTYLYLSASILPILRKRIIERSKARKNSGERLVVVSTQVVESGVDIDLDVVYRAFAPLDSINQSAGRCNREGERGERGVVKLFPNASSAKKIYKELSLFATEQVLKRAVAERKGPVIPEATLYELNEAYAYAIRKGIADKSQLSKCILTNMRRLYFEEVEREMQLIPEKGRKISAFIDDPERIQELLGPDREVDCSEVWRERQRIIRDDRLDRWDKKRELRLLRPRLLQYVVQIPVDRLPTVHAERAEEVSILHLIAREHAEAGDLVYDDFYDLVSGYAKKKADEPHTANF